MPPTYFAATCTRPHSITRVAISGRNGLSPCRACPFRLADIATGCRLSVPARDGHPAAAYALFDTDLAWLTYHRVPYDNEAAARKVRAAGLPEEFALRLETGA